MAGTGVRAGGGSSVLAVVGRPGACRGFVTELVARCARGDEQALLTLLDVFHEPARRLLAERAPHEDVEDLLVEGFARIWSRAADFRPGRRRGACAWVLDQLLWSPMDSAPTAA